MSDITATKQTTNSTATIETAPTIELEVVVVAPGSIILQKQTGNSEHHHDNRTPRDLKHKHAGKGSRHPREEAPPYAAPSSTDQQERRRHPAHPVPPCPRRRV